MQTRLTLYFEDPFWVGVFERQWDGHVQAARVVFGSEPSDAEVYAWLLENHARLDFGMPVADDVGLGAAHANPKRRLREAQRQLAARGTGTKAHEAMRLVIEARKSDRVERRRMRRDEEAARKFAERTEKRKRKHRGH